MKNILWDTATKMAHPALAKDLRVGKVPQPECDQRVVRLCSPPIKKQSENRNPLVQHDH